MLEEVFSAIRAKKSAFGSSLYLLSVSLFVSKSPMNVVENIGWLKHFCQPDAVWCSLTTLKTIGFGDVLPLSPNAKLVGAFTSVMGVCLCLSATYLHCWLRLYQADFEAKQSA